MPETLQTDLVVLGGGPGGYSAAFLAADLGIQTTLIDATRFVGRPGERIENPIGLLLLA